jgi:hypothetical protein
MGMAVGIHQGILGGRGIAEPLHYAAHNHPLYELALLAWPGSADLDALVALMNGVSWLSMGGAVAVFYLLSRRLVGWFWALVATAAMASSPLFFELSTYGHPVTPALFSFLLGAVLLVDAAASGFRSLVGAALGVACLAVALGTRSDVLFFMSAIPALSHAISPGRRTLLLASAAVAAAVALYLLGTTLLPSTGVASNGAATHHAGVGHLAAELWALITGYCQLRLVRAGLAAFCFAAGPGMCLLVAGAAAWLARRKAWSPLLHGAAIVLPTLLFWLGNPSPARHFLHADVGCALFLALAARDLPLLRPATLAPWISAVLVANLGLVPFAGAAARAAGHRDRCVTASATCWLLGQVTQGAFAHHRRNQRYIAWNRARWERLWAEGLDGALLVGTWTDVNGLKMLASAKGLRILRDQQAHGEDSEWVELTLGGHRVHFWQRSARARTDPRFTPDAVYILAPYPPSDLAALPAGQNEAPAWREDLTF